MSELNPDTVQPTEGKVLVEITEVLGAKKGRLWTVVRDDASKDTAFGVVVKMGPQPSLWHKKMGRGYDVEPASQKWPAGYPSIKEGDLVVFPRDVPKAWNWEDHRYALILLHEVLMVADPNTSIEVEPREF